MKGAREETKRPLSHSVMPQRKLTLSSCRHASRLVPREDRIFQGDEGRSDIKYEEDILLLVVCRSRATKHPNRYDTASKCESGEGDEKFIVVSSRVRDKTPPPPSSFTSGCLLGASKEVPNYYLSFNTLTFHATSIHQQRLEICRGTYQCVSH